MTTNHTTPAITFSNTDPRSPRGRAVIERFYFDIVGRYWNRPATQDEVTQAMIDEPSDNICDGGGFFIVAQAGTRVIGCGGVKIVERGLGELTRVFVASEARGGGLGRRLISELESISARRGIHTLRLTVRADLAEAHTLYLRQGYVPVDRFSDSPYADHQLAKVLDLEGHLTS